MEPRGDREGKEEGEAAGGTAAISEPEAFSTPTKKATPTISIVTTTKKERWTLLPLLLAGSTPQRVACVTT